MVVDYITLDRKCAYNINTVVHVDLCSSEMEHLICALWIAKIWTCHSVILYIYFLFFQAHFMTKNIYECT